MAGISLHANLSSLKLPQEVLERLGKVDTQPARQEIGEYLLAETLNNFEQEQTPEGKPWQPSFRAQEQGGKTLQQRGHLRDSYTYLDNVSSIEVGSNLIYAAIHHQGGVIKGKSGNLKFKVGDRWVQKAQVEIPARPALGITDENLNEIGDILLDFYAEVLQ